jgi:hypothetical protein
LVCCSVAITGTQMSFCYARLPLHYFKIKEERKEKKGGTKNIQDIAILNKK